jgi:hypothetical protein
MATPQIPLSPRALQLTGGFADVNRKAGGAQPRSIVVSMKAIKGPLFKKRITEDYRKQLEKAVHRGVKEATKFLLKETLKVTPKSEQGSKVAGRLMAPGNLRNSGHDLVIGEGAKTKGIVFFDAVQAPYAIFVHEDLSKYHKPPTIAKFLQKTQWDKRGEIAKRIADECAKVRP